jgi:hypothetical protein
MITDEQKKAFAELIKDAERRFESGFNDYLKSLKEDLTPKLEAKSRARVMMEHVRALKGKLAETLHGLRKLGYHVDDGMIAIDYDTREETRQELDEVKRSALAERNKSIAKFRKAIFEVWSAQDVEQAKRIAAEVL